MTDEELVKVVLGFVSGAGGMAAILKGMIGKVWEEYKSIRDRLKESEDAILSIKEARSSCRLACTTVSANLSKATLNHSERLAALETQTFGRPHGTRTSDTQSLGEITRILKDSIEQHKQQEERKNG